MTAGRCPGSVANLDHGWRAAGVAGLSLSDAAGEHVPVHILDGDRVPALVPAKQLTADLPARARSVGSRVVGTISVLPFARSSAIFTYSEHEQTASTSGLVLPGHRSGCCRRDGRGSSLRRAAPTTTRSPGADPPPDVRRHRRRL
jgi:hypothetical protein